MSPLCSLSRQWQWRPAKAMRATSLSRRDFRSPILAGRAVGALYAS